MNIFKGKEHISIPVFILVVLFELSSWIDMNGLFVELPLFVNRLPEGWRLPSYLSIVIQASGFVPFMYVTLVHVFPRKIKEWPFIIFIILTGAASCFCLVFLWDKTAFINGQHRSIGLLSFALLLAITDATSNVVYYPYMAQYKAPYLVAIFIGDGVDGIIPSLVGLAQGADAAPKCVNMSSFQMDPNTGTNTTTWTIEAVYNPPVFSIEMFLLFLFGMMVVSGVAFLLLHLGSFSKVAHEEICTNNSEEIEQLNKVKNVSNTENENISIDTVKHVNDTTITSSDCDPVTIIDTNQEIAFRTSNELEDIRCGKLVYMMLLNAINYGYIFGALPSIFPYSSIPYGYMEYSLVVKLCPLLMSLAPVFNIFFPVNSLLTVLIMTAIASSLVAYHVFLAVCSPFPPLQGTVIGSVLSVSAGVLAVFTSKWTGVALACKLKASRGRIGLLWYGASIQIGCLFMAVLFFVLINEAEVFVSKSAC